jgi:hypothetical protein
MRLTFVSLAFILTIIQIQTGLAIRYQSLSDLTLCGCHPMGGNPDCYLNCKEFMDAIHTSIARQQQQAKEFEQFMTKLKEFTLDRSIVSIQFTLNSFTGQVDLLKKGVGITTCVPFNPLVANRGMIKGFRSLLASNNKVNLSPSICLGYLTEPTDKEYEGRVVLTKPFVIPIKSISASVQLFMSDPGIGSTIKEVTEKTKVFGGSACFTKTSIASLRGTVEFMNMAFNYRKLGSVFLDQICESTYILTWGQIKTCMTRGPCEIDQSIKVSMVNLLKSVFAHAKLFKDALDTSFKEILELIE